MSRLIKILLPLFLTSALMACETPPKVIEGTVVSYDAASGVIVIRDECAPNADLTLSAKSAEIGAAPEVNDVVRVAYRDRNGNPSVIRLMNLTRQKEIGSLDKKRMQNKCKSQAG